MGAVGAKQIQVLKERMEKSKGKEQQIIHAELMHEEAKFKVMKSIEEEKARLDQLISAFNDCLNSAIEKMVGPEYLQDVKESLFRARTLSKDIADTVEAMKHMEKKLISVSNSETKLLKKELLAA